MATLEALESMVAARIPLRLPQGPFRNEPLTDFSQDDAAREMRLAQERVRAELGREYDLVIGGKDF